MRAFQSYDDAFEIIEHAKAESYAIRLKREPYSGIVVLVHNFQFGAIDEQGNTRMDFDYEILEAPGSHEELHQDNEFRLLIAHVVLNLFETANEDESNVEPIETVTHDDGSIEVRYDVSELQPHGEIAE